MCLIFTHHTRTFLNGKLTIFINSLVIHRKYIDTRKSPKLKREQDFFEVSASRRDADNNKGNKAKRTNRRDF